MPVAVVLSWANRHDVRMLEGLLDATVVEPTPSAPPHLAPDRGYDDPDFRAGAAARGYAAHIPKASAERPPPPPGHPDHHPPRHWVVEAANA